MINPIQHECAAPFSTTEQTCKRCGVTEQRPALDTFGHTGLDCIAALKRDNAELRQREERVAVAFVESMVPNLFRIDKTTGAEAFAAFRKSEAYPK